MGCSPSGRSYIEENITEMWKNTKIREMSPAEYIEIFEKATAYKKDLRTHESFCDVILNNVLQTQNPNAEIDHFKNAYLDFPLS